MLPRLPNCRTRRGLACAGVAASAQSLGSRRSTPPAIKGDYSRSFSRGGHGLSYLCPPAGGLRRRSCRRYPSFIYSTGIRYFRFSARATSSAIDDKLPEAIVVASLRVIRQAHHRRHIDFMPPGPGIDPKETRVADFHNFLEREVRRPSSAAIASIHQRVLFGQSRAGALTSIRRLLGRSVLGSDRQQSILESRREIFYGAPRGRRERTSACSLCSEPTNIQSD